jgi:hypothetical protein
MLFDTLPERKTLDITERLLKDGNSVYFIADSPMDGYNQLLLRNTSHTLAGDPSVGYSLFGISLRSFTLRPLYKVESVIR